VSHSLAVLSSDAVRMRVPSCENTALRLRDQDLPPSRRVTSHLPSASHNIVVLSSDMVRMRVPSGEKIALRTSLWTFFPLRLASHLPLASHSRAVLSSERSEER